MNCLLRRHNIIHVFVTFAALLWLGTLALRAVDYYVATNGAGGDYKSWGQAASNIQWAVNVATNGETVWVSNGVYGLTNQIDITNGITLRSTNGPDVTLINGNFIYGSAVTNNRCLWMSNVAAFVSGFTFSNGAVIANGAKSSGGGILMYRGTLSNCVVCDNKVFAGANGSGGGGIIMYGGTVTVCRVSGNILSCTNAGNFTGYGGGLFAARNSATPNYIFNCVISNNTIIDDTFNDDRGGGVNMQGGRIVSNIICNNYNLNGYGSGIETRDYSVTVEGCTIANNQGNVAQGAGFYSLYGVITNCVISGNNTRGLLIKSVAVANPCLVYKTTIAGNTNGGVELPLGASDKNLIDNCIITNNTLYGVKMGNTNDNLLNSVVFGNKGIGVSCSNGIIRNCLIAGNTNGGMLIGATCKTALVSCCTIASNWGDRAGSGLRIEATNAADARLITVSSCVIYSNGVSGTDDVFDAASVNAGVLQYSCVGTNPGFTGAGIIVADPKFKDFNGGNYRLASGSPCVNAGSNETWMTNTFDLDGKLRLRFGRVDSGAYEYYPRIKVNGVSYENIRFINGAEMRLINGVQ